ncbi:MAG: M48 family metalloprotease, partial [Candidatus Aminicenantes bacterium]
RKREFLADASAAMLTRYPPGLASALRKISDDREFLEAANKATAHLYIVNPLKNVKGSFNKLFSTHPPIEERIAALEKM